MNKSGHPRPVLGSGPPAPRKRPANGEARREVGCTASASTRTRSGGLRKGETKEPAADLKHCISRGEVRLTFASCCCLILPSQRRCLNNGSQLPSCYFETRACRAGVVVDGSSRPGCQWFRLSSPHSHHLCNVLVANNPTTFNSLDQSCPRHPSLVRPPPRRMRVSASPWK